MIGENTKRFKSMCETYIINSVMLTLGLMYPNPKYDKIRKKLIICVILSVIPVLTLILHDMHLRILRNDMPNLVRQSIVLVSIIFVLVKLILSFFRKEELLAIFDDISKDYELFNDMPEEYQNIIEEMIQKTKKIQMWWFIILSITATSYPVLAGVCTLHSQIYSENPKRCMVHEITALFFAEELMYETPYFELVNLYLTYIIIVMYVSFVGFDGTFFICMRHISLKLKIYNKNLNNLLINVDETLEIKRNIAAFVNNYCETERLLGEIQKCFEVWLVGIFLNAILQLGMTLTQFTHKSEGGVNAAYFMFAVATLVHIYLPCYLASEVTSNAAEIGNVAYSCSWERVQDVGIKKSICIILAKTQVPMSLTALGMITFNMELFVSILQTAYSMYTLCRNRFAE